MDIKCLLEEEWSIFLLFVCPSVFSMKAITAKCQIYSSDLFLQISVLIWVP
ncbi:hypothetical protein Hanom_Chr09g00848571 [Helianthus anomalus]